MLNLEINGFEKRNYIKYLSSIFISKLDLVDELSDYTFFKFNQWLDFICEKYCLIKENELLTNKNYIVFIFYRSLIETLKEKTFENRDLILNDLTNSCFCKTNMYLNFDCKLGGNLDIYNASRFSLNVSSIGDNCEVGNNVIVNKKDLELKIKNNVVLKDNVVIIGGLTLKDNSKVNENCVLTDSLEEYDEVNVINQLQITNTKNKIHTKKLEVYGIIPKFKNAFVIIGEGFYNPTVLIKLKNQNKELRYEVDYWDKNKIIVKVKNTTPLINKVVKGLKIVILSNEEKVVILNNFAVEKCLVSLKN